jgi:site-specific recombinase XerD
MIDVKHFFKRPAKRDVFELGEQRLAQLRTEGRYSCYRSTRATLRKLSMFRRGKHLQVKDVTPELMADFRDFLMEKMGNSHNTVCENIKIVAKLLTEAGVEENLCARLKLSREQNERTYLLEEELLRIMSLRLKRFGEMDMVRDIFFVECRTGLRISDLLQLRWDDYDGEFIRIRMQKTKRRVEIPVTDSVRAVFEKYRTLFDAPDATVFPFLDHHHVVFDEFILERKLISATARVNQLIKKLAQRAGVEKNLSTHVGRHTFATMLINKGASIYDVKELLGHQDVKVTQIYAHMLNTRKKMLVDMLE